MATLLCLVGAPVAAAGAEPLDCREFFARPIPQTAARSGAEAPSPLTFAETRALARTALEVHPVGRSLTSEGSIPGAFLENVARAVLAEIDPQGYLIDARIRREFERLALSRDGRLFPEFLFRGSGDGPVARLMSVARSTSELRAYELSNGIALFERGNENLAQGSNHTFAADFASAVHAEIASGAPIPLAVEYVVRVRQRSIAQSARRAQADYRPEIILSAFLQSLDPYTEYLPPSQEQHRALMHAGSYEGLGIVLNDSPFGGRITAVSPDSPSARGGVQVGDIVVGLNGDTFQPRDYDRLATSIRTGAIRAPGRVALRLSRGGRTIEVTMAPEQVARTLRVEGVARLRPEGPALGLIRISEFSAGSAAEVHTAIRNISSRSSGLVLDLRGNLGGSLREAMKVVGEFLPPGTPVMRLTGGRDTFDYDAQSTGAEPFRGPLVVLVDRNSASGSEAIAGALQAYGRALVVGERTFGKGAAQGIVPVPLGLGAMRVTTGYVYLPDGRSPHVFGILPDIEIASGRDRDEALSNQRLPSPIAPFASLPPRPPWSGVTLRSAIEHRLGRPLNEGAANPDRVLDIALAALEELSAAAVTSRNESRR